MSDLTEQLKNIDDQVVQLVNLYNSKQTLSNAHLTQIQEIQKKLDNIGLTPVGNSQPNSVSVLQPSKENSIFSSLSRLNPFKAKPTSTGGRYSHKRKSVKRRSTKKGGRKHK
jgi:hypothetical protein